ncbi:DUF3253 domain-containing protein [Pseudonocardia sp. HH130629-09]|uniref:DUF3253 domain-containing protein n=1 Tax=Pseudonocardia sp. HH130629-09 TaxID=1641402 RepID=UPI001EE6F94E|nr:DUF3253 domain-containing protein [Pseudonocardia sp. HH130629-09]
MEETTEADDGDQDRGRSWGWHRGKVRPVDTELESAITGLLYRRRGGATICPSEAARAVDPDGWRDLMEPARTAARRLVDAGRVEIVQSGRVVDPSTAKGPIRIRRVPDRAARPAERRAGPSRTPVESRAG